MMRILVAFIILLGSIYLGIQLHRDPGYLLISINHWTIETTVWVALIALILLFLLGHFLLILFHKIAKTPQAIRAWNHRRLAHKAQATTRQGLIEYSEGYWKKAQSHLMKALPNTDTPLLNYLTAARAAQKMGDSQLRDHYLREAQQSMPEAKVAVELTQAQLQLANCQWEQALATLRHLQDLTPHHPYVLKLLMHLYEKIKDWTQLIRLLPELKKYQVVSGSDYTLLQQTAYLHAMKELIKQNQTEGIINFYNALPKSLAQNSAIIALYTQFLCNTHAYTEAENLLKRCLRKEYDAQLIELYSILPGNEQQLNFAESLLKKNPHSASLLLCLGRICMARHLWGKAKHYFELAIELDATPVTYMELGKLQEKLQDEQLACATYKKGLEVATTSNSLLQDRH